MRQPFYAIVVAALLGFSIAAISYLHTPGDQVGWGVAGGLSLGIVAVLLTKDHE